jgi:hypothetical protein
MSITRRAATLGGLGLLAGASASTVTRAEPDSFLGIGELRISYLPPTPTSTAIRLSRWR